MNSQIRDVMRFAGPKMLYRHPILAIRHLLVQRRTHPDI
ncbi:MAG: nitrous oxide-stimulated promoter family protein [Proteobacteria bacterium]|nr:nitrous oxide-stimulated promoter family protein [Pseudomonadota bacterium]